MQTVNYNVLPSLDFEPGMHGSLTAAQVVGPECVVLGVILGISINKSS